VVEKVQAACSRLLSEGGSVGTVVDMAGLAGKFWQVVERLSPIQTMDGRGALGLDALNRKAINQSRFNFGAYSA